MANFFNLILDTTSPSNVNILINGGSIYASEQLVTAAISTTDTPTTGYQMKIWGDVDNTHDTNVQTTEGASSWITYATSKQIKLSNGDNNKTLYCKIRDDVLNPSGEASDSILLDMTAPVVNIAGADVSRISKQSGKNVASFSFQVDTNFVEYKVKVVSATGAAHDTGVLIPTTNGSINMSGVGTYAMNSPINCSINGADLELASAGDGTKIIKVFVREASNNWSV